MLSSTRQFLRNLYYYIVNYLYYWYLQIYFRLSKFYSIAKCNQIVISCSSLVFFFSLRNSLTPYFPAHRKSTHLSHKFCDLFDLFAEKKMFCSMRLFLLVGDKKLEQSIRMKCKPIFGLITYHKPAKL